MGTNAPINYIVDFTENRPKKVTVIWTLFVIKIGKGIFKCWKGLAILCCKDDKPYSIVIAKKKITKNINSNALYDYR